MDRLSNITLVARTAVTNGTEIEMGYAVNDSCGLVLGRKANNTFTVAVGTGT